MTGLSASDVNEDADVRAALKATIISLGGYDDVSNIVAESTSTRRRLQDEDGAKPGPAAPGRADLGPTTSPTAAPTGAPTSAPTTSPTGDGRPTTSPTAAPTLSPTAAPTTSPTAAPAGADLGSHDQPDGRPPTGARRLGSHDQPDGRPHDQPDARAVGLSDARAVDSARLDIDGEAADDWSGYSVSLSADGTTLAVGAPFNDGAGSNAGHARVFAWDPSTRPRATRVFAWDSGDEAWIQRARRSTARRVDQSGYSVSLSADGTTLAVGAVYNAGGGSSAGHARVFAWNSGDEAWVQRGDIDGEAAYDYSGVSVSLSADGTALAVGAYENDGAGSNAGHARVRVGPVEETGSARATTSTARTRTTSRATRCR
ncbi:hypothetical protein SO694_00060225 [Aureococcus anophagefferens]|uniref:PKD domain-containing protein n=1 Tax=Aureococcus anophagefferens TaxID=44056 RepID=A0ABR1FR48_AURAN